MTVQKKQEAPTAQDSLDEIDQIMNEIEELQQGMAPPAPAPTKSRSLAAAPPVEEIAEEASPAEDDSGGMAEFQAGGGEVSMEETLGDLKDDEPSSPNLIDQTIQAESEEESELLDEDEASALDEAVSLEEAEVEEREVPMEKTTQRRKRPESAAGGEEGTVALTLSGNMKLKVSYEFEGQDVSIGFADGALHVQLSDGTEFKIPVRRNPLRKIA